MDKTWVNVLRYFFNHGQKDNTFIHRNYSLYSKRHKHLLRVYVCVCLAVSNSVSVALADLQ